MAALLYSPWAYAALAVVLGVLYAVYRAALPKPIPGIPYHKASAAHVLGDIPSLIKFTSSKDPGSHTFAEWFAEQSENLNSPIFQLFLDPFGQPTVCITDPRESLDILLRRPREFDRSNFFKQAFSGSIPKHHIVQSTNDKFRAGRRLVADTMTTPFLHGVAAPHLHKHSRYLMELWRVKMHAANGHAFAAARDLNHMALDSIWEVAYGSELKTLSDQTGFLESTAHFDMPADKDDAVILPSPEFSRAVKAMLVVTDALDVSIVSPFPALAHWCIRQTPSYRRARAYHAQLVHERLHDAEQRLLHKQDHTDKTNDADFHAITSATDLMVKREAQMAQKEGRKPIYDSPQATDELLGFLVAGHETTATTLMWLVKMLADNPHAQQKLRHALYETAYPSFAAADKLPSVEAIVASSVPYLDAFIEEVLRLGVTTLGGIRSTTQTVTVLGHVIPKDVEMQLLAVGPGYIKPNTINNTIPEHVRSASSREHKGRIGVWDDADIGAFKPERWLKRTDEGHDVFDMNAGPNLQFGGGLRGCFGKRLAYLEMKILVTIMVWTFEFLPVSEKLGGYVGYDTLTHKPINCYIKLKETGKGGW